MKTPPRTKRRPKPANHVGMAFGKGWTERNFLSEVVIPSMFQRRHGARERPAFPALRHGQLCLTWVGHASFLLQTPEHSVLIDPNWARWLKVIKRIKHPGVEIHDLPAIDLVLVTHAHFDHLDRRTLKKVAAGQPIAVPEHVGTLVHGLGFERAHELKPWQSLRHGHLTITLTPARHWGARVLHDSHRGFGGFLIEYAGRTVFHCGDSAYFDGFREIGERADIDIALLPIGAYDAPTKRDVHMNPEEALRAFVELRAALMVPMHFGTFRLSYEPLHEPLGRLVERARELGLSDGIQILSEGIPHVF
jgi:L-ascorbate metabolism protein UlaG (beta-lactamase superfamily)